MNWLDIVLLVVLVVPTFFGLKQGIIKAVLSLVGIIIGVVVAGNYYEQLADAMGFIENPDVANIVAYVIILGVIMVIATVLARFLKSIVKAVMLGWVNNLGGAIFGFLMGCIFLGGILATIVRFFGSDLVAESFIAGFLLDKFPLVLGLLPEEFDMVRDFFK
ncbi:MAG: CvpA family protein [Dehalococcoidales bacterium]|nr:CvpA family protein [Dehalococcoidales bacterium]